MSSRRKKDELADFGEVRACQLLRNEGFEVERMPKNFPFYDLMATRGSCRLLVSSEDAQQHHVQGKAEDEFLQLVYQAGSPRGGDEDCSVCRSKNFLGRGNCRCKGPTLFRLHGRGRQTAVAKMYPNASYSRRFELQVLGKRSVRRRNFRDLEQRSGDGERVTRAEGIELGISAFLPQR
jgi:hypothetical protein